MIDVKNLHKEFGEDGEIKVLKGIDYTIEKGDKIVIVGPSGGGKSTFLRCLNLLETPTNGDIYFHGEQINSKKCNINKVRQKMGMVFQHFNLFPHMTILDNLTLAPVKLKLMKPDEAKKKIEKIDKSRAAYYKYYTGKEWNDPVNYDLCINTTKVGFDGAVDIIIDYMKRKGINV